MLRELADGVSEHSRSFAERALWVLNEVGRVVDHGREIALVGSDPRNGPAVGSAAEESSPSSPSCPTIRNQSGWMNSAGPT